MKADRVLVAFGIRAGSTAAIAEVIAAELSAAGLAVDCLAGPEVQDLAPYRAVILGSGVFLPRRRSDGGGFLARHAEALTGRAVWLFCAGPIGDTRSSPAEPDASEPTERAVVAVARDIGARGTAVFGYRLPEDVSTASAAFDAEDIRRVHEWARTIATELCGSRGPGASDGHGTAGGDGRTQGPVRSGAGQPPVTVTR